MRIILVAVFTFAAKTVVVIGAVVAKRRAAAIAHLETAAIGDSMAVSAFHHRHIDSPLSVYPVKGLSGKGEFMHL